MITSLLCHSVVVVSQLQDKKRKKKKKKLQDDIFYEGNIKQRAAILDCDLLVIELSDDVAESELRKLHFKVLIKCSISSY